MTDDEFLANFEDCSPTNESFHHSGHIKMAFLYSCRYPAVEAIRRFSTSLARFAAVKGKPGLCNETVTWGFLLLIHERMARAGHQQVRVEFAVRNSDLFNWEENVLKKYYLEESLASELAKNIFVFPDKLMPCLEKTN